MPIGCYDKNVMLLKSDFMLISEINAKFTIFIAETDGWIEGIRMKWKESGTEIITIKKSDGVSRLTPGRLNDHIPKGPESYLFTNKIMN